MLLTMHPILFDSKYYKYSLITTSLLALISLMLFSYQVQTIGFLYTYFLFLGFGVLILKGANRSLFLLSTQIGIIFSVLYLYYVQQLTGTNFNIGGDEKKFYDGAILAMNGNDHYLNPSTCRYWLFVLRNFVYFNFLKLQGFTLLHSFHANLLNVFTGSFSIAAIYQLGLKITSKEKAANAAIFLMCIPMFVFYQVNGLRDMSIALLVTLVFNVTLSDKYKKGFKYALLALIIAIIGSIRFESPIYMLFFLVNYEIFKIKDIRTRKIAILLVLGAILLIGIVGMYVFNLNLSTLNSYSDAYNKLRELNGGNSLASRLKNAPLYFKPIVMIYVWLSPLPPPALIDPNDAYNIWMSIGCAFWYVVICRGFWIFFKTSFQNSSESSIARPLLIGILLSTIVIVLTSCDARHLLCFYAPVIIYATRFKNETNYKTREFLTISTIVFLLLAAFVYFILKF